MSPAILVTYTECGGGATQFTHKSWRESVNWIELFVCCELLFLSSFDAHTESPFRQFPSRF